jgi:8-oxo-dGTP diphosphatase
VITRTCLCLITRTAGDQPEVLLGLKKTGFGAGKWVGLGGHIEDGESPVMAAVREVQEESGLMVRPDELAHRATLMFRFPARPSWDQTADVYLTAAYQGEAVESDEIAPRWFRVDALPLDGMWDDARYWLPLVLDGQQVTAEVTFADDCATVASIQPGLTAAARATPE